MHGTTKVLIADDHSLVRTGLKQLLEIEEDIEVVGEASDGQACVAQAKTLQPDVVVLDIAMPGLSGLEAIALIKRAVPRIRIIILSMYSKEAFAHEALQAGAQAYVLKGSPSDDLIRAIRAVSEGRYFFSEEVHAAVIDGYVKGSRAELDRGCYESLSDREREFFQLMLEGKSTNEISNLLSISVKTGEKHRTSVVKKLGISNPIEMVKYAVRIGLIDPDTWKA